MAIVIWNMFYPWPNSWWTYKFLFTSLLIPGLVGLVSTVWFTVGGIVDLRWLFIDLDNRNRNVDDNDNGQVINKQEQE